MNLTLWVKLQPNPDQAHALLATMERFNAACDVIAATAFREHTANKMRLQKLVYTDIRETFGLSAQMTVRAISKVAEAYKRDKAIQPTFRPHGAIVYDQRLLSWKGLDRVSILTLTGRQRVPVVMDSYHRARMDRIRGQADLIYRDGTFFLAVVVDIPEPLPLPPDDWLGTDLGIVNLAADSNGGKPIRVVRSTASGNAMPNSGNGCIRREQSRRSGVASTVGRLLNCGS